MQADLNLLRVFIEVYRHKSITRAADSLMMTQPGVSAALKRLQEQLTTTLFIRDGRGISPTQEAVQLADEVAPALEQVQSALSGLQAFSLDKPRRFRVLVNEPIMILLQPLVAADKTLGNISIEFALPPLVEEELSDALSLQQADLAIDVGRGDLSGCHSELLHEDNLVMIARRGHPAVQGKIDADTFYQQQHIALRLRRSQLYPADYFTPNRLGHRKIVAECDSLLAQLAMVSQSDAIGSSIRSVALGYGERFGLQVMPFPFETLPIQQWLIWHKRTQASVGHQWLRQKIRQYLDCLQTQKAGNAGF